MGDTRSVHHGWDGKRWTAARVVAARSPGSRLRWDSHGSGVVWGGVRLWMERGIVQGTQVALVGDEPRPDPAGALECGGHRILRQEGCGLQVLQARQVTAGCSRGKILTPSRVRGGGLGSQGSSQGVWLSARRWVWKGSVRQLANSLSAHQYRPHTLSNPSPKLSSLSSLRVHEPFLKH